LEIIDPDSFHYILAILSSSAGTIGYASIIFVILAILVLLIGSALMSGSEVAFFSLGPNQLHELRTRQEKSDLAVLHLLEMPKRLLATILISNNFINVAIVIISTFLVDNVIDFEKVHYWVAFWYRW